MLGKAMTGFPKEINVILGKVGYENIQNEEWGAFDMFRRVLLEHNKELEDGLGIRLARPFYEKFVQHLLMFDDVFRDLEESSDQNQTAIHILEHIKTQLTGKHYQKLKERDRKAQSMIAVPKGLIDRIITRRAEKNSLEALLKQKFLKKQFDEEGTNMLFWLKGQDELRLMRDTLAYAAMVEALQTSSKKETRKLGDKLAKENYLRVMLAHHILDAREGYRVKGDVLEKVRQVLEALDKDQNGVLSLHPESNMDEEEISPQRHPELWKKLRSYDTNGDGYITADEQVRLKEAIAGLIQRGIDFDQNRDDYISFDEVERILVDELPLHEGKPN